MNGVSLTTVFVPLFIWCITLIPSETDAVGCTRCLNGGQAYLPNSIFGTCKCRCKAPFRGPACQFSKRSGPPLGGKFYDDPESEEEDITHDNAPQEVAETPEVPHSVEEISDSNASAVLARILSNVSKQMRTDDNRVATDDSVEADRYLSQRAKAIRDWMYGH